MLTRLSIDRSTSLRRPLAMAAGWLSCTAAMAHDGHGLWGSHWHATDVMGFVAVIAAMVAALWWGRK